MTQKETHRTEGGGGGLSREQLKKQSNALWWILAAITAMLSAGIILSNI